MSRATAYFTRMGALVEDVSATESYDLRCMKEGREFHVEVKGTTGSGEAVLLTRNEVAHAERMFPEIGLFVVAQIELLRESGRPIARGGLDRVIFPWRLDRSDLEPLAFSLQLRANQ